MSQTELGALLVALSVTAYFLGKLPTLRSVGVFVGIILVGLGGTLGGIITHLTGTLHSLVGTGTTWAFGVTSFAIFSGVLAFIVFHDWLPRNSAKKRTFVLSALLAILIATGTTGWAALNHLDTTVKNGVSTVQGR